MGRAAVIYDDRAWRYFDDFAPERRPICTGTKFDHRALGDYDAVGNGRKCFAPPLHPQTVWVDLYELRVKITFRRGEQLNVRGADCRLVAIRIRELKDAR